MENKEKVSRAEKNITAVLLVILGLALFVALFGFLYLYEVADSVPEKEYEECINKAKAVVNALKLAKEADL